MFIYEIVNTKNNKRYVGQTIQSVEKRWKQHIRELQNNKHRNAHLQYAWNMYGADAFKFSILETCSTKNELDAQEKKLVDNVIQENGYNLIRGGHCESAVKGKKFPRTNEIKDKYARIAKPEGYPILVSPTGIEHTVVNVKRFSREHNLTFSGIQGLMNGGYLSYKGWYIKGHTPGIHNENISIGRRPKRFPLLISPDNRVYEIIPTLRQFCKQHNLSIGCVSQLINDKKQSYKNWIVKKF